MKLTGNTILITGGASGIGLALTKSFLDHNNQVIVVGRDSNKLESVKRKYPDIITHICDINDQTSQDELILFIEKEYSHLNILVNNAGIQQNYSNIEEFTDARNHKIEIETNLSSPIRLCQLLLPLLLEQRSAAIVNVTSALAFAPKKSAPVYCASKAALHIFSKSIRYQLENTSVKVFEIIPSIVDTEMTKGRGKGKISPEIMVEEFFRGFEKDRFEINIGKAKILRALSRFFPTLADNIIKNND